MLDREPVREHDHGVGWLVVELVGEDGSSSAGGHLLIRSVMSGPRFEVLLAVCSSKFEMTSTAGALEQRQVNGDLILRSDELRVTELGARPDVGVWAAGSDPGSAAHAARATPRPLKRGVGSSFRSLSSAADSSQVAWRSRRRRRRGAGSP